MRGIIIANPYLNLRATPDINGVDIGNLMPGLSVEIIGEKGDWFHLTFNLGSSTIDGWVWKSYVDTNVDVTPTPTPTPTKRNLRMGFNHLGIGNYLKPYLVASKNPTCIVLDNIAFANEIALQFPNAQVAVRHVASNASWSVQQWIDALEGANNPKLYYTLENEGDGGFGSDPKAIHQRFELSCKFAQATKMKVLGGGFSTGVPDITRMDIRIALMNTYGMDYSLPANKRILAGFHCHAYSPNLNNIFTGDNHKWYETRSGFYFTDCGFDVNSDAQFWLTETGLDEGNIGGFSAHKCSADFVIRWTQKFQSLVNSVWASPITGLTIPNIPISNACFFVTGRYGWEGYQMDSYIEAMSKANLFN